MRVAVIGGGVVGVCTAYFLAETGHEVTVLDDLSNASPVALRRVGDLAGRNAEFVRGDVRDTVLLLLFLLVFAVSASTYVLVEG
jgi:UDP-glucose 4-epimerase